MRLSQTRLLVADLPASVRFYRDILGLGLTSGVEENGFVTLATEGSDGSMLALFDKARMGQAVQIFDATEGADRAMLVFKVDDLDATLRRIREHGGSVAQEPIDQPTWGLRVAYLRDPDDNLVELASEL